MIKYILFLCTLVLFTACGSSSPITETQIRDLETAVTTPHFTFNAEWANPLDATSGQLLNSLNPAGGIVNGNRVLLDNGSYAIQVKNDSLIMNLPYFGTRQISGGLPGNTGIKVEQPLEEFMVSKIKKDSRRDITMTGTHNSEAYDVSVTFYAGGHATVVVNSSQRQSIRYTGTWE